MTDYVLDVSNVEKSFNTKRVLSGLSFSLGRGGVYALIGANGTGKTTLFNIISGFLPADGGDVRFNGCPINNLSPNLINTMGISRTFQEIKLARSLSVKENILLAAKMNSNTFQFYFKDYPKEAYSKVNDIINQLGLDHIQMKPIKEISYGEQKLVSYACCIANDGELYLLDEPVAGISSSNIMRITNFLRSIKDRKKTVLLVEHNREFIEAIADRLLFLSLGKIIEFTSYSQMKSDPLVQKAYL